MECRYLGTPFCVLQRLCRLASMINKICRLSETNSGTAFTTTICLHALSNFVSDVFMSVGLDHFLCAIESCADTQGDSST